MRSCLKTKIRTALLILLVITVLVMHRSLPTAASAQQDSCTQRVVFVSVEDENGQPVSGLTAANFHAILGKQSILITKAKPAPVRRIVILLDRSGSMYDDYMYRTSAFIASNLVQRSAAKIEFA